MDQPTITISCPLDEEATGNLELAMIIGSSFPVLITVTALMLPTGSGARPAPARGRV